MRTVFADAGYWVALVNPSDDLQPVPNHHHRIPNVLNAVSALGGVFWFGVWLNLMSGLRYLELP
jgi:hypothetical protein